MVTRAPVVVLALAASLGMSTSRTSVGLESGNSGRTGSDAVRLIAMANAPDTGVVRLRFDWPVGMKGSVEASRMRVRKGEGQTDSSLVTVTYAVVVADHADGRLIHYNDFRLSDADESSPEAGLMQSMASMSPPFVVSPDGDLLYLTNLEEFIPRLKSTLMESMPAGEREGMEQFMAPFFSEEALTRSAAEQWNLIVGAWAGGELEVGAVYEFEGYESVPMLGGQPILYEYSFSLVDWAPCNEADSEARCVELLLTSEPDPEDVATAIGELMDRLSAQLLPDEEPPFRIVELSPRNTTRLIAEPGTLIPHYLQVRRRTEMVAEVDGQMESGVEIDLRESRFTYPR